MSDKTEEIYKEGNYEFYIEKVKDDVCKKYRYPIKQKYAEAVAEYRNLHDPSMITSKKKYKAEDVRGNLSKAIDRLCKKSNPPLICIREKCYVLNNGDYLYEILCEEFFKYLKDRIIVDEKGVLLMSHNVCAFWAHKNPNFEECDPEIIADLVSFNENDKEYHTAHKYIAECLGDHCFAVFGEEKFIQVMVKVTAELGVLPDDKSKDFAVVRALEYAIARIYEKQHIVIKSLLTPMS